jgi:hypothetical protein
MPLDRHPDGEAVRRQLADRRSAPTQIIKAGNSHRHADANDYAVGKKLVAEYMP